MRLYDSINDSSADITHFYRIEPRSQVGTAVPTDYATVKKAVNQIWIFWKIWVIQLPLLLQ